MTGKLNILKRGSGMLMDEIHPYEQYRQTLDLAIVSKCNEFAIFGYNDVTSDQLWEYLLMKKWKKRSEKVYLHQLVNDVLTVKIGDYMHYKTIEAFKYSEQNKGPDFESFKDLFT